MQNSRSIRKLLVANRGEIACRIMRSAKERGIKTVAIYSEADWNALHVREADESVLVGAAASSESYLRGDKIIQAALDTGADAIHPGYGFLSENPDFADAVSNAGLIFIGPSAEAMKSMALKGAAKSLMEQHNVPVVPGYHGDDQSIETLQAEADRIGYPVLIKAVAGGGGKGMRQVDSPDDLAEAIEAAAREGQNSFGNPKLLIEKFIVKPRHIEFQVFGDTAGNVVHLWERDCSIQRRHQKVIEEAPAPGMTEPLRAEMGAAAVAAAKAISYAGAGTVEFIVDVANGLDGAPFYFMEMNTRLQVEHPVTELLLGEDLVRLQIEVAEGSPLPFTQGQIDQKAFGHAVEARLYAEDPFNGFLPQTGTLHQFSTEPVSDYARVDSAVEQGDSVTVHYDPMIAKVIAWGPDRDTAIATLCDQLSAMPIIGLTSNRDFLIRLAGHPSFKAADLSTGFINHHEADILSANVAEPLDFALATTAVLCLRQEEANSEDPWYSLDTFAVNLPHTDRISLSHDETNHEILCARKEDHTDIQIDDQIYRWTRWDRLNNHLLITLNGRSYRVAVEASEASLTLVLSTKTLTFNRPDLAGGSGASLDAPGDVKAPMPGKILSVMVANGDEIKKGAPLLVMEAMKMEQTLKAPRDGIVSGLNVAVGDQVSDGKPLLSIETPETQETP